MRPDSIPSRALGFLAVLMLCGGAAITCAREELTPDPALPANDGAVSQPVDDGPPVHSSAGEFDAGVCWSDLAPMNDRRAQHAAVTLTNGDVLVFGGIDITPLSSVERYDREEDAWSFRSPMPTARRALVATALDGGRVLVTGGAANKDMGPNTPPDIVPLNTVELYDPQTDTWQPRTPMNGRRWLHAAHRLPDGRVLVAGGVVEEGQVAAEIYNPVTDTWTPLPFPDGGKGPRFVSLIGLDEHAVMVVTHDASYLIDVDEAQWRLLARRSGGAYASRVGGEIWAFADVDSKWSQRFNADAGGWQPTDAGFALGRNDATGLVLEGGRYMMTGGYLAEPGWAYAKTSVTDLFDSDGGVFLPAGRLKIPRLAHAMVELRPGVPMVIGGGASSAWIGAEGSTSVEVFDPTCSHIGDVDAQ